MKKVYTPLLITLLIAVKSYGQYALQLYGGVIVTMSGGTSGTPIYINVNEPATTGIYRATTGHIISEGQYNYVSWITNGSGAGSNFTGSYVFPFGKSGTLTEYLPVTFNKTAATAGGAGADVIHISTQGTGNTNMPHFAPAYKMKSVYGGGDSLTSVIDRWWSLNATGVTANVTFSCLGSENTTTAGSTTFFAQRWNTGSSKWDANIGPGAVVGTTAATVYTVTANSISSFSPWILSAQNQPLPVELLNFSALCRDGRTNLSWSTASETNNDHFTVERSIDGSVFTEVTQIKGAGNSSSIKKYETVDLAPEAGLSYYRLYQTDYNGQKEYFKVVAVNCDDAGSVGGSSSASEDNRFAVYPNPSNGENVVVKFNGFERDEAILVVLIDMLGQTVYTKVTITDATGTALEAVDVMSNLAAGVYTVVGSVRDEIYKQKLIIR